MSNRFSSRHLVVAAGGAFLALLVSGWLPAGQADARPQFAPPCRDDLHRYKTELARVQGELHAYQAAYQELHSGLQRIEQLNERRPRKARHRIRRAVEQTRRRAARHVSPSPGLPTPEIPPPGQPPAYPPSYPQVPGDHEPAYPAPVMSPADFQSLRRAVERASFDSNRIGLVTEAARHSAFTVAQVIDLMKVCSFENTKIEVAAMLYPVVVDPENWYRVYSVLSFSSSHTTLQERIR